MALECLFAGEGLQMGGAFGRMDGTDGGQNSGKQQGARFHGRSRFGCALQLAEPLPERKPARRCRLCPV